MSDQNPDLLQVQVQLIDTLNRLRAQLEIATDAPTIQALVHEIIEVDHRITLVGRLLFSARTEKITAAANKVGEAKAKVDQAIADVTRLTKVLNTISSFLGLVDKVIDLAKLL